MVNKDGMTEAAKKAFAAGGHQVELKATPGDLYFKLTGETPENQAFSVMFERHAGQTLDGKPTVSATLQHMRMPDSPAAASAVVGAFIDAARGMKIDALRTNGALMDEPGMDLLRRCGFTEPTGRPGVLERRL